MTSENLASESTRDADLMAAQAAFLTLDSLPAAKIIRRGGTRAPDDAHQSASVKSSQVKGVRFQLDELEEEEPRQTSPAGDVATVPALMGDIVEREGSAATPVFVTSRAGKAGFPAPRKFGRGRSSGRRDLETKDVGAQTRGGRDGRDEGREVRGEFAMEHRRLEVPELMEEIDRESRNKLADMSKEEILEMQRSLRAQLSPTLQQLLLDKSLQSESSANMQKPLTATSPTEARANTGLPAKPGSPRDTEPLIAKEQDEASHVPVKSSSSTTHPRLNGLNDPNLDDPSFDAHLRSFFPSETTSQPDWTLPIHPSEETFYSATEALPSTLRFDLNGKYLPPETSRTLPTHLGLHHHALDPGSAGYTVSELSILARSTQPSQKCIAVKILGNVLRDVASDVYDWEMTAGLWEEIERERIIPILVDLARGGTNRTVQRYAQDAMTKWAEVNGLQVWEQRMQEQGYEKISEETC
jgi:RNA polymerase II-associated protein 1